MRYNRSAVALAVAALLCGCAVGALTATTTARAVDGLAPIGPTQTATEVSVVDGDTMHVRIGGVEYTLRYIGMNRGERRARQAGGVAGPRGIGGQKRLVDGQTVYLERDVSEVDGYDRLLRYVWLHEGDGWLMVDRELVREGFAESKAYPPTRDGRPSWTPPKTRRGPHASGCGDHAPQCP